MQRSCPEVEVDCPNSCSQRVPRHKVSPVSSETTVFRLGLDLQDQSQHQESLVDQLNHIRFLWFMWTLIDP